MKFILNQSYIAKKLQDNTYILGSTLDRQFQLNIDAEAIKILMQFKKPISIENAIESLESITNLPINEVKEIINWAISENIITRDFIYTIPKDFSYDETYDRQLRLFSTISKNGYECQNKLSNARIALIGIGGTGSYILYSLAAMGVGFVRAIDFDIVQKSNLSRQILYGFNDLGKLKVDCAKNKINALNPNLNYEYINLEIKNEEDIINIIDDVDFCILSADTPRVIIKEIFHKACMKKNIPHIYGGSNLDSVIIGPLVIPNETITYEDILDESDKLEHNDELVQAFRDNLISTLIDPYNAIAGSYIALETIKFISGFSEPILKNKMMIIDLNKYQTTLVNLLNTK